MNEEEKLNKITKFLEKGCTMLADHHDCGAPLFRCKGKIVCPICSSGPTEPGSMPIEEANGVVSRNADKANASGWIRNGSEVALSPDVYPLHDLDQGRQDTDRCRPNQISSKSEGSAQNSDESSKDIEFEITKRSLRKAVLFRLNDLSIDIKDEKDLHRLRSLLDCVDAALGVIRAMK